jgi:hypothetical protein
VIVGVAQIADIDRIAVDGQTGKYYISVSDIGTGINTGNHAC